MGHMVVLEQNQAMGILCRLSKCSLLCAAMLFSFATPAKPATTLKHYFAHDAVVDNYGVIAPWYKGQNGQFDYRVRIAAETIKRYPWVDRNQAVAPAPAFVYDGKWSIDSSGKITVLPETDWNNGDVGDRAAVILRGMIDYYAYSGDPASFAIVSATANYIIGRCETGPKHPWPDFLISVPTDGVRFGDCRLGPSNALRLGDGKMQLDIVAEVGSQLIRAYEMEGNSRWYEAAKHWGDLLAERRRNDPLQSPWGRWADNQDRGMNGIQTGGDVLILSFLDELIRSGYQGRGHEIVRARDAALAYFQNVLLPSWWVNDSFGRSYWDWEQPDQGVNITDVSVMYMMQHQTMFPNWKNSVRNLLSLFLNHASVDPASGSNTFNGAWAYPESAQCCGRSLSYPTMELAMDFARFGVEGESSWSKEIARRSQILATYDALDNGQTEDLIQGGGSFISKDWFKIAQPAPLVFVLNTMKWLPEIMGPNREDHIMRTTSVVDRVIYGKDKLEYSTFDAGPGCVDVLRLAYRPTSIMANGTQLLRRQNLRSPGYTVSALPGGDFIVSIRHDRLRTIRITGNDPQTIVDDSDLHFIGKWRSLSVPGDFDNGSHVASDAGGTMNFEFTGNQVRLVGSVRHTGGLARVFIDNIEQLVPIDCYSPVALNQQILYYKNGLSNGHHKIEVVVKGEHRPLSNGTDVYIDAVEYSGATGDSGFGKGGGPVESQRMIFGYTNPRNYIDSKGNSWHPGTEFIVRSGSLSDSVAKSWWTIRQSLLINEVHTKWFTPMSSPLIADPELYRYGVHWKDFTVNTTVGPGTYHIILKFNETQYSGSNQRGITIFVNGKKMIGNLDVFATAGGSNKAADIVLNDISPQNGVIAVRFMGCAINGIPREAMVQAIEIGPGEATGGMQPKSIDVLQSR